MRLIKYSAVGSVATFCHYLLLLLLVEIVHLPASTSSSISALLGAFVAYYGNYWFTFKSDKMHFCTLPRFLFVTMIGALTNDTIVSLGVTYFELHYLVAQLFATGIVLLLAYHLNQHWTFAS